MVGGVGVVGCEHVGGVLVGFGVPGDGVRYVEEVEGEFESPVTGAECSDARHFISIRMIGCMRARAASRVSRASVRPR